MRLAFFCAFVVLHLSVFSPAHAEVRPNPGTDLTRLSATARNGEIIHLSAGSYPGQIQVVGKTLTILGVPGKTILTGSKAQSVAYVAKGGTLTLSGVVFRTRLKDGLAVYLKGGGLALRNCEISKTVQPAIYADKGSVEIDSCRFADLTGSGVVGINDSKIAVKKSRFEHVAKSGVVVQKSGSAAIRDSLFSDVREQAVYVAGKAALRLEKTTFRAVGKSAVVVSRNSHGTIAGCGFENLQGAGVVALDGSGVSVTGNRFRAVKGVSIHLENGSDYDIRNNSITGSGDGIVVVKGTPTTLISGNTITGMGPDKVGIAVQSDGALGIDGNVVIGGRTGIDIRGNFGKAGALRGFDSAVTVRGNTVLNQKKRSLDLDVRTPKEKPAKVTGNRLLNGGELAVLINSSPHVALTGNVILAAAKNAVFVQNRSAVRFRSNIIGADGEPVVLTPSAGSGSGYSDDIFIGTAKLPDGLTGDSLSQRVRVVIRDRSLQPKLAALMKDVRDQSAKFVAAADVTKLQVVVAPLLERRKKIIAGTAQVAFVTMKGVDIVGNRFDGAYTVLNDRGNPVSEEKTRAPKVAVMPGTYFVEPAFAPKLVQKVTIAPGKITTVTVKSRRHLVMTLVKWDNGARFYRTVRLPVRIAGLAAIRRALAPGRNTGRIDWFGTRRADATATDLESALKLARARETELKSRLAGSFKTMLAISSKDTPKTVDRKIRDHSRWQDVLFWWQGIMAVAGTEDDARRLVAKAVADPAQAPENLRVAAAIERRLGILDRGALLEALDADNKGVRIQAARILYDLGISAGRPVLSPLLKKSALKGKTAVADIGAAVSVLSDRKDPAVLAAARALLQRAGTDAAQRPKDKDGHYKRFAQSPVIMTAAQYLIAYGNLKDWRTVAETPIHIPDIRRLMPLFDDPVAAVRFDLGLVGGGRPSYRPVEIAKVCDMFLDMPSDRVEAIHKDIEGALYTVLRSVAKPGDRSSSIADQVRYEYRTHVGWCRPNRNVAELIFSRTPPWILDRADWMPRNWDAKNTIADFFKAGKGHAARERQLDSIDHDTLKAALEKDKVPPEIRMPELLLAWHKIGSRRCVSDICSTVFRSADDPPGAVTANYRIRPYFLDHRLRIALRTRAGTYKKTSLASMIGGMLQHIDAVRDSAGKNLIRKVFLMRGDRRIPLKEVGRNRQGEILYEAKLDETDLHDLRVHFQLQFLKQTDSLDFDLTAVPGARDLRIAAEEVAQASKRVDAVPSDTAALRRLGDGLRRTGQIDAAWKVYDRVLAGSPQDASLWLAAGRMFSDLELYGQAEEVLKKGVETYGRDPHPQTRPYARMALALASAAFENKDYEVSEKSYGQLARLIPRDPRWKWWQAANQMIRGHFADASAFFRTADMRYQRFRTALFRYLSASRGARDDLPAATRTMKVQLDRLFNRLHAEKNVELPNGKKREIIDAILSPGDAEAENLALRALAKVPESCTLYTLLGIRDIGSASDKLAKDRLRQAVTHCSPRRLERRLANAELARGKP